MPDVRLLVNGREYFGWKDVTITRGIEAIAFGFSLSVSERWNPDTDRWPIHGEDECQLLVDGVTVVTGWVDKPQLKIAASDHTVTLEGRGRTSALIDNSCDIPEAEFNNMGVLELCERLAKPYGIPVALQAGIKDKAVSLKTTTQSGKVIAGGAPQAGVAGKSSSMSIGKPIARTPVASGDSPFEIIDKSCRLVGVLPVDDGRGGLLLTRTGGVRASTALVLGKNILSAEFTSDASKRYRTYKVIGQSSGGDLVAGEQAADVRGTATDPNVKRSNRTLIVSVSGEGVMTPAFAKQRAAFEATTRAARSQQLIVEVADWKQDDGSLWPINALVQVRIPPLDVDGDRLIVQTEMKMSVDNGTTTRFTLAPKDAYTPEPVVADSAAGAGSVPAAFR